MRARDIKSMLDRQRDEWNRIYNHSKALDAGLVLSVLNDLQSAIDRNTPIAEGDYAGMISCYGSDKLKDHVFKKETQG